MSAHVLLLFILLAEGIVLLQLASKFKQVRAVCLFAHAATLVASVVALLLMHSDGLLFWPFAALALAGFAYDTLIHNLLEFAFIRQASSLRYQGALRTLRWLQYFPGPQPVARRREEILQLETLRRGNSAPLLERRRIQLTEARATGDSAQMARAAVELVHSLILARHWEEAIQIHEETFAGQLPAFLAPATLAMLARAYGTVGNLAGMTRAVAAIESRRDQASDIASLNIARLIYLAYQGAAAEIDVLLGTSSGLLSHTPAYVYLYYRGIAHFRAGAIEVAEARFAAALAAAPEEERRFLTDSIALFRERYGGVPAASPGPAEAAFIIALNDRLSPYAAVPRAGVALSDLPVTWGILAINTAVWICMALAGDVSTSSALIDAGALYSPAIDHGEWWRLIIPIFLHAGFVHVALNSLGLLFLGSLAERLYGRTAFWLLYLVAGVAGTCASWQLGVGISVGASGAIFGILGGLIALLMKGRARFPEAWRSRYLKMMLLTAALNVFLGLQVEQIDNAAHIGGLIGGFLVGTMLAHGRWSESRLPWVRALFATLTLSTMVLTAFAGERAMTTSREQTLARLPQQTLAVGALRLVNVPGSWLLRPFHQTTVVLDPFANTFVEITTGTPLSILRASPARQAESAVKEVAKLQDDHETPRLVRRPNWFSPDWLFQVLRRDERLAAIVRMLQAPDGREVIPLVLITDQLGLEYGFPEKILRAVRFPRN